MARIRFAHIVFVVLSLPVLMTGAALALFFPLLIFRPPILGDAAIPMGPEIEIPDSRYYLHLYGGPAPEETYFYGLFADAPFRSYQTRTLGPLNINVETVPTLEKENEGVYRITWGTGPSAPFTVIDVKHRKYIEDSNPDNARNELFQLEHQETRDCPEFDSQQNDS